MTMQPCNKRQTIVKRSEGLTLYRCINTKCGMHGDNVDEGICSRCPVRSVPHKPPCKSPNQERPATANVVTVQEMMNFSDEDVKAMMAEVGLEPEDFDHPLVDVELMPPNYPPLSMQMWTYKEALIRWSKAGWPSRTKEEIQEILDTHCHSCDWYDANQKRCRGCGCKVTESSIAIFNKLKMATEHCPKGLW